MHQGHLIVFAFTRALVHTVPHTGATLYFLVVSRADIHKFCSGSVEEKASVILRVASSILQCSPSQVKVATMAMKVPFIFKQAYTKSTHAPTSHGQGRSAVQQKGSLLLDLLTADLMQHTLAKTGSVRNVLNFAEVGRSAYAIVHAGAGKGWAEAMYSRYLSFRIPPAFKTSCSDPDFEVYTVFARCCVLCE